MDAGARELGDGGGMAEREAGEADQICDTPGKRADPVDAAQSLCGEGKGIPGEGHLTSARSELALLHAPRDVLAIPEPRRGGIYPAHL